jgi:uncharacterized repeat protein (TIGR01451 family)
MLQFLLAFYSPLVDEAEASSPGNPFVNVYNVTPGYGTQTTVFTYHATYEDPNGSYPQYMKVRIDGTLYTMQPSNGSDQKRYNFTYSTTLNPGQHNYSIVYSSWYTPNSTQYETPVKWGPYVEHNFVDMNATSWNTTTKNCNLVVSKALLNATVGGDLGGTINFTEIKMVAINQTPFEGNGFATGNWTAEIELASYSGFWKAMFFAKPAEKKIYFKGTVTGGMKGITSGVLTESSPGSGIYDTYNASWTVCQLGGDSTFANLTVDGDMSVQNSTMHASSIYIVQGSFQGNGTGYYNGSLNVVLTHVRVSKPTDQYYGKGFSIMSYTCSLGNGEGWTVDDNSSTPITLMKGWFTKPYLGIVTGELNESGTPKKLSLSIERIDYGQPPKASLLFDLWGSSRMVPGSTENLIIRYSNSGLKAVTGVKLELRLDSDVNYISNTGGGTYSAAGHKVSWQVDIPAKSKNSITTKIKVKWGLQLNTYLHFYLYVNVTEWNLEDHHKGLVVTARDPNAKNGPTGNVSAGQKLDYQLEFENEGNGTAYGVYFTDVLDANLDDSTLIIGPVKDKKDNKTIGSPGAYDAYTRTITWFAGEVGPGEGGYANVSVNINSGAPEGTYILNYGIVYFPSVPEVGAPEGTYILNYGIVYFPSVPEVTQTNGVLSRVKIMYKPVANAGGNKLAKTLEDITFDASLSSDSDGQIVSYAWDFGDGNTDTGKIVTHQYADDGVYNVKLTVTDNDGKSGNVTVTATIQNRLPEAALDGTPGTVQTFEDVTFTSDGSTDMDGTVTEYFFNFGDGSNSGWVSTPSVVHQYAKGGTEYTVSLAVKDDDGDASTNGPAKEIMVNNRIPTAHISADKLEALTFEDITFNGEMSDDMDGNVVEYFFDFGDSSDSGWVTTASVKHQYTDGPADYDVVLTIKDDQGAIETATVTVSINNRAPTAAALSDQTVNSLVTITFDAVGSTDMDGTITSFSWNFGDSATDTGTTAAHSYAKAGVYTVTLTVTDDDGATGTSTGKITVMNQIPTAGITVNLDSGDITTVFEFQSKSFDLDGSISKYTWLFGDEGASTDANPTHQYTKSGEYTVTLVVEDDDGAVSIPASKIISVINTGPVAKITAIPMTALVGEEITYDGSGSTDLENDPLSFAWDFGDGKEGTGMTLKHSFDLAGLYTTTLTVTDTAGNSAKATVDILINIKPDDTVVDDDQGGDDVVDDTIDDTTDDIVDDDTTPSDDTDKGDGGTGTKDKGSSTNWNALALALTVVLILLVLFALYMRVRKVKSEEKAEETEESEETEEA